MANIIDEIGTPQQFPTAHLPDAATGSAPQGSAMARGGVRVDAAAGTPWMMLATARQVFSTFAAGGMLVERVEGPFDTLSENGGFVLLTECLIV